MGGGPACSLWRRPVLRNRPAMNSVWKFRCLALLIIVFVGGVSMTKLLAKFLRPARALLPSKPVMRESRTRFPRLGEVIEHWPPGSSSGKCLLCPIMRSPNVSARDYAR